MYVLRARTSPGPGEGTGSSRSSMVWTAVTTMRRLMDIDFDLSRWGDVIRRLGQADGSGISSQPSRHVLMGASGVLARRRRRTLHLAAGCRWLPRQAET